jgi:2,3-bisphosphoglycerate-independent phosphoglycerate mutase
MPSSTDHISYIICVGDGMADRPVDELDGKTPLEYVDTPALDAVVHTGISGLVRTVPSGMAPGSDVANMSLLGYDPARYYTGRAPIEAAGMGIALKPDDVALRCNLVSIRDGIMHDYAAGHIGDDDAHAIVSELRAQLDSASVSFHPGTSYRHLVVLHGLDGELTCTPPHDISGRPVASFLPGGDAAPMLQTLMDTAHDILSRSPVNAARVKQGKTPVTDIWLWGNGHGMSLPTLHERYALGGSVITAVNLIKGLGTLSGLKAPYIEGATGYLDTDYGAKVTAAKQTLEKDNFVFIHCEAPDETSHEGSLEKKCTAIRDFDRHVVAKMLTYTQQHPPCRLCVLPDHATPLITRTHDTAPVPFGICGHGVLADSTTCYAERTVMHSRSYTGPSLFEAFITGNFS